MATYIFDTNPAEREYRRLRLIEEAHDPTTIALLVETGIQRGWHCLELGPGAGSILRWIGKRVGPEGLAVGIDKQAQHLHELSSLPYHIYEGQFLEVPLDYSFDLIHVRYVLIHNPMDEEMLKKMFTLLKPGGWAVIEEPDFTSATLPDPGDASPQAGVNRAMCRMFTGIGLHPEYGLLLPSKLEAAGFHTVRTQSIMHLCAGDSPIARVMGESALVLQEEYCRTGLCSPEDIQHYVNLSRTPSHWSVYHSTTSTIVRKPLS